MKDALYHDSQSNWNFPLFAEDSQHKPPTNSEVVARGCKLPHIVFSEHRGASFRSWSFRSPSILWITQCLRALTQKGIKSGTIIHSFASSTSSGLTHFRSEGPVTPDFAKRQHAHHEHAAHGRGRSGAHGPADTAKVCPTDFSKLQSSEPKNSKNYMSF